MVGHMWIHPVMKTIFYQMIRLAEGATERKFYF